MVDGEAPAAAAAVSWASFIFVTPTPPPNHHCLWKRERDGWRGTVCIVIHWPIFNRPLHPNAPLFSELCVLPPPQSPRTIKTWLPDSWFVDPGGICAQKTGPQLRQWLNLLHFLSAAAYLKELLVTVLLLQERFTPSLDARWDLLLDARISRYDHNCSLRQIVAVLRLGSNTLPVFMHYTNQTCNTLWW